MTHHRSQARLLVMTLLFCSKPLWSMDLLQAYEAAKASDPTLLASRAGAAAGRERLPQALAPMLPNLSLSMTRNHNQLSSVAPGLTGEPTRTDSSYPSSNRTLSLRQPIIRTYLTAQYRQAQAQVEDTHQTQAQDEQDLAVRVSSAYFEAMLSHEQLAFVRAQRAAYQTQLAAAQKLLALGSGTRTDVDEARARLDMTQANEIEARQGVDYTMHQLQAMVSQPIDRLATVDLVKFAAAQPEPADVQSWIARAELKNHRLRSLQAQLEVARGELAKAETGHMPTLDAVVQWTRSMSENVVNIQSTYSNYAIGLQLNIPIYAGGQVASTVRQAHAALERAGFLLEAGRRELAVSVHKEFRGVTESMARVTALEQALRSADQLLLSNQKSVRGGNRTLLDVMNAEQQRMLVLRDLAQARYLHLLSRIRLLALAGSATTESIAAINQSLKN